MPTAKKFYNTIEKFFKILRLIQDSKKFKEE